MDKLAELDQLIEQVLGVKPRGVEVVTEKSKVMTASEMMPPVPFPKLQINKNWGRDPEKGFDVKLFREAGLTGSGDYRHRLQRLAALVDCTPSQCPTSASEILSRLVVMDIFASILLEFRGSTGGFLFENFMALLLQGNVIDGTKIQDIEAQTTREVKPVSLKLLRHDGYIGGSEKNLEAVLETGQDVLYIVGFKPEDKSGEQAVGMYTLKLTKDHLKSRPAWLGAKSKTQFKITAKNFKDHGNAVGAIPIYSEEKLRTKAEELLSGLNTHITEIYTALNTFSSLLTQYFVENNLDKASEARSSLKDLKTAVAKDKNLSETT